MTAYDSDPRVSLDRGVSDVAYDVTTADGDRYVYQDNGGFMTSAWDKNGPMSGPFATADEAIRSLIGEPS